MSVQLPVASIQALQVITVAVAAPLVTGVIARVEALLQGRRGPRILQTYYDLGKMFGKESLMPAGTGGFFLAAPLVSWAAYLAVPLMIPVLTSYLLPLGYTADILGAGIVLALGSFVVSVAAAQTGDPYAQLGSSRAKTFGSITEPVTLLVFFTAAIVSTTDLPYAVGETVRSSPDQIARPAHILASVALFMVILFETGRIPIESHSGTIELGMIDEARPFEHSGPYLALLKWGSSIKQLVLFIVLINVFVAPWGMTSSTGLGSIVLAILALLGKACLLGCVIAVIDDSFAKLRLMKITEFVAAAFLLAVLALFTLYLGGG